MVASSSASTSAGGVHNYNGKIGFLNNGSLDLTLVMAVDTTGKSSVQVKYDIMTIRNPYDAGSNTRINEVSPQYRLGTSGAWTTITGAEYQNNTTLQTGAVTTPQNSVTKSVTLPSACDNQSVVQIRWAQKQVSGSGSRPSFALDNVVVCTTPAAYGVTGGGSYCTSGSGVAVGLANSETGVAYQLKKDGVDSGGTVSGTGSAISFGLQTVAGTYTVVATRAAGGCTANMTGSAIVLVSTTSSVITVSGWSDSTGPGGVPQASVTMESATGISKAAAPTQTRCTVKVSNYAPGPILLSEFDLPTDGSEAALPPGTVKVVFLASKLSGFPGLPAVVRVLAKDACNNRGDTDPALTSLEVQPGGTVRQVVEHLSSAERYLHVFNGTPGLRKVEANLNGRLFQLPPLTDGKAVAADLSAAMLEGDNNTLALTGYGEAGASAVILVADKSSVQLVEATETVMLTLNSTETGLTLSWPVTLTGWHLQASTAPAANWSDLTTRPVEVNGQWTVTVPASGGAQFYRLQGPGAAGRTSSARTTSDSGTGIAIPMKNQPQLKNYNHGGHSF